MAPGDFTPQQFAVGVLQGLKDPINQQNVAALVGWAKAEGGHYNGATYNFLNTTEPMPGAGNTGSQGNIKVYRSPQQGVNATVRTLNNGRYGGILHALDTSNARGMGAAIGASPWGTSGGLASQTINDALSQKYNLNGISSKDQASQVDTPNQGRTPRLPSQGGQGTPGTTVIQQHTSSSPDWVDAGVQALLHANAGGIDQSGNVGTDSGVLNDMTYGAYAHPTITKYNTVTTTPGNPGSQPMNAGHVLATKAVNDAAAVGANADSQKLLRMVHMVSGAGYSQANHDAINQGGGKIKALGTDCSGFVSWLMGPQGLGIWHGSLATPAIPNAPGMRPGVGKQITVYNNANPGNAGHVFIEVNGQYWASEGGVGVHQLPRSEVQNYLANGSDGGHYVATHPRGL